MFILLILSIHIYHKKLKKSRNIVKSKKSCYLLSVLIFDIYLVIDFNFVVEFSSISYYSFRLLKKFLFEISVVLIAYYFFSKAVKGFKDKRKWRTIMKRVILFGAILDLSIFVYMQIKFMKF